MKLYRVYVCGDGIDYSLPGGAGYCATVIEIRRREFEVKDAWVGWALFWWCVGAVVLDVAPMSGRMIKRQVLNCDACQPC